MVWREEKERKVSQPRSLSLPGAVGSNYKLIPAWARLLHARR